MSLRTNGAATRDTSSVLKVFVLEVALAGLGCAAPQLAAAQDVPAFAPGMINHMQQMKRFKDVDRGQQPTPPVIPRLSIDPDPTGAVATFQPNGATFTSNNAFFQNLGTNGRTCFSCHQPQDGWSVSAADVATRFATSRGTDPIFRLVEGATCPSDDVSTFAAKQRAYKLLIDRGLIRIGLPIPTTAQFVVTSVDDPYNCNTNPTTGRLRNIAANFSTSIDRPPVRRRPWRRPRRRLRSSR